MPDDGVYTGEPTTWVGSDLTVANRLSSYGLGTSCVEDGSGGRIWCIVWVGLHRKLHKIHQHLR